VAVHDLPSDAMREAMRLFDDLVRLSPPKRADELERLSAEKPAVFRVLQRLLSADADPVASSFLEDNIMEKVIGDKDEAEPEPICSGALGPWTLERLIGRGGMGQVWLARRHDGLYEGRVAIKMLRDTVRGLRENQRFAREGRLLGRLSHPNIARLLDAGFTALGERYLVLEYVDGLKIDEYCDVQRLDVRGRVALIRQVCAAVIHAHAHLVVHRDLKPSNILVMADGTVKLLDFGVAKLIEDQAGDVENLTFGEALTPGYAAPEQILGGPITTATDVYALGVILYELLCGERPHGAPQGSPLQIVRAVAESEARLVSQRLGEQDPARIEELASTRATEPKRLLRNLKGDLDNILAKALRKDADERYGSIELLAEDLDAWLECRPVRARPASLAYRGRKFARRHWMGVTATVALLASVLVGAAGILWEERIVGQQARTLVAVQGFLQDIFEANSSEEPNPQKARNRTARELLDVAANKIDASLNDAPEAKLKVLDTLADMYTRLGLNDQAALLWLKRADLAKRTLGAGDPAVGASLVEAAGVMKNSRYSDQLGAVLREAEDLLDRRKDQDSPVRVHLLRLQASYEQDRDLQKAASYAARAVQASRHLSPRELSFALVMEGNIAMARRDYAAAETDFSEALAVRERGSDLPPADVPKLSVYLGLAQLHLSKFAEADASYRKALEVLPLIGEEHIDAVMTQKYYGEMLVSTSRLREGLERLRAARDIVRRTRGPANHFAAWISVSYGRALAASGMPRQAKAELEEALQFEREHGVEARVLALALDSLAEVAVLMREYEQSERLLQESEALHSSKPGGFPEIVNNHLRVQALLLIARHRGDEALELLRGYRVDASPSGVPSLTASELTLLQARAELDRGNPASAERLAVDLVDRISHSSVRIFLRQYEAGALLILGKARTAGHKHAEAASALDQAAAALAELYEEGSPLRVEAGEALAWNRSEMASIAKRRAPHPI
jgi:serine/threonine-protein kinase